MATFTAAPVLKMPRIALPLVGAALDSNEKL